MDAIYGSNPETIRGSREVVKDSRARAERFRRHFDFEPDPNAATKELDETMIAARLEQMWVEWIADLKMLGERADHIRKKVCGTTSDRRSVILENERKQLFLLGGKERNSSEKLSDALDSVVENGYRLPERFIDFAPKTAVARFGGTLSD
jgi:hypothetical protein